MAAMSPMTPPPPDSPIAVQLRQALNLQQQNRYPEALGVYQRVLDADPTNFEALHGLGMVHGQQGHFEAALRFFTAACEAQPGNFVAHFNRGKALQALQRHDEALAAYDRSLALKPDFAQAYNNRGSVLKDLARYEEALDSYRRAVALQPDYANAHNNLGALLQNFQRPAEALASCDRAIALRPQFPEAYHNRGNALRDLQRYDEALASYAQVIALNPNSAQAFRNRGDILLHLQRYDQALSDYDRAIALDPDMPYIRGNRLYGQMNIGLWEALEQRVEALTALVAQGLPASRPFPLLSVPVSAQTLRHSAELFMADKHPPAPQPLWQGEGYAHERIRLGYFSADFFSHATACLISELIERHDRARFEVFAFSFGPVREDVMRARLVKAFDHFFDLADRSDREIAALARQHEIDIAVDLKGLTQDSRPGIFALRPAPVQVNYLGFPGTMGAPYIDYILADPVLIPDEHFPHYSEKVVRLPHSYQVNDSRRPIAETTPNRRELGLPETGFVFCCFNNNYKITPDVFDIWMRLLARVDGSVLWLLEGNDAVRRNLGREAAQRGISPQRLIFAPRQLQAEHLARHRRADLFLDTFYCNAHTTASDALWAGLPVLTRLGDTFAGRVAASLLQAVGLPELITHNHEEYETLALRLATHPTELAALKARLAEQRLTQPLFDTALFTRHIEQAYTAMCQRHRQGLAPNHLCITP